MATRREIEKEEHEQWTALCDELEKIGAVTNADRKSPVGQLFTSGQFLFALIRRWGELRAMLGARDEIPDPFPRAGLSSRELAERQGFTGPLSQTTRDRIGEQVKKK